MAKDFSEDLLIQKSTAELLEKTQTCRHHRPECSLNDIVNEPLEIGHKH